MKWWWWDIEERVEGGSVVGKGGGGGTKFKFFLMRKEWISQKLGRSSSFRRQVSHMSWWMSLEQFCGRFRGSKGSSESYTESLCRFPSTSSLLIVGYGECRANVRISQNVTPNDQMSLFVEYLPFGKTQKSSY